MPNPAWFNEEYFLNQKVEQMNLTQYKTQIPDAQTPEVWDVAAVNAELDYFGVTAYDNFVACNEGNYGTGVTLDQINVSGTPLFNVGVYCENVAAFANAEAYNGKTDWDAQSVLESMLNDGHQSAWTHYLNEGMKNGINPSNLFDTSDYIDSLVGTAAGDTPEAVIATLQAAGSNPIEYFMENGGTVESAPAVPADEQTPEMGEGWQWGGEGPSPVPGPEPDPYDPTQEIDMTLGQDVYPGEGENYDDQNTQFNAKWASNPNNSTIQAKDQIDGGSGNNTLSIDIGSNWRGFNGVPGEDADGKAITGPSLTNIGRIELNHSTARAEQALEFNAKNIGDVERIDINASGAGVTSVTEMTTKVQEVHFSDLKVPTAGAIRTTYLSYADDATKGDDDTLTLVFEDMAVTNDKNKGRTAEIEVNGIEHITVDTLSGDDNESHIELKVDRLQDLTVNAKGNAEILLNNPSSVVSSLTVTGNANVNIGAAEGAKGVSAFDASEATGEVTVTMAGTVRNDASITGGSGYDTVTLTQNKMYTFSDMSDIESIRMEKGGTFNAANVDGLTDLWAGANTVATVKNLVADDFAVWGEAKSYNVNGTITNFGWQDTIDKDQTNTTNLKTDAIGNVNLTIDGKGTWSATQSTFSDAGGDITLTTGADNSIGGGNFTISAENATALNVNIAGSVKGDLTFNVIGEDALGQTKIDFDAAKGLGSKAVKFDSDGAADMEITATSDFTINSESSLKNLANLTVEMTEGGDKSSNSGFNATSVKMENLQNAEVDGGGLDVKLGNLGTHAEEGSASMAVGITNAKAVEMGDLGGGIGSNINVTIEATDAVTIGNVKTYSNTDSNDLGDITLTISGTSVNEGTPGTEGGNTGGSTGGAASPVEFEGGQISIDVSDLMDPNGETANVSAFTGGLTLRANEAISYLGSDGADGAEGSGINVAKVGADSYSTLEMGGGDDYVQITGIASGARIVVELGDSVTTDTLEINLADKAEPGDGNEAVIDVVCGQGVDTITLAALAADKGMLHVNVEDFGLNGSDSIKFSSVSIASVDAAKTLLEGLGIGYESNIALTSDGGVWNGSSAYYFNSNNADNVTTILCLEDVESSVTLAGTATDDGGAVA